MAQGLSGHNITCDNFFTGESVAWSIRNQRSSWTIMPQKEGWTTWTSWCLRTDAKWGPYAGHWRFYLPYWTSRRTTPLSPGWHRTRTGRQGSSRGYTFFLRNWERHWWNLKSWEDNMFQEPQPLQLLLGGFRRTVLVPHPPMLCYVNWPDFKWNSQKSDSYGKPCFICKCVEFCPLISWL